MIEFGCLVTEPKSSSAF